MLKLSIAFDIELDEVRSKAREIATRLLFEGALKDEDRSDWIVEVKDDRGSVVLRLTVAEATGTHDAPRLQ